MLVSCLWWNDLQRAAEELWFKQKRFSNIHNITLTMFTEDIWSASVMKMNSICMQSLLSNFPRAEAAVVLYIATLCQYCIHFKQSIYEQHWYKPKMKDLLWHNCIDYAFFFFLHAHLILISLKKVFFFKPLLCFHSHLEMFVWPLYFFQGVYNENCEIITQ